MKIKSKTDEISKITDLNMPDIHKPYAFAVNAVISNVIDSSKYNINPRWKPTQAYVTAKATKDRKIAIGTEQMISAM